jgi:hypothetical protein
MAGTNPAQRRRIQVAGFTFEGLTLDPGKRQDRVDAALAADAIESLRDAPIRSPWFSGLVAATKGTAGSDGYAYRNRVLDSQVPVRSVVKTVAETRALILSMIPEVPALVIPADTDAAGKKALRDAHKAALAKREEIVPQVYRDAPDGAFTWCLVKVQVVKRDGVVIAGTE